MPPPPPKNLLLSFDAFGTLIRPRRPIMQQYAEAARACGVSLPSPPAAESQLQSSFRSAFKSEAKVHPNYGKETGLGPADWWTNVIQKTFEPLLAPGQRLPLELAPSLLHRFSSDEGYELVEPRLASLLRALRASTAANGGGAPPRISRLVVGVVTNSDDRVPDVLSALGLRVSPLRFPADDGAEAVADAAVGGEECDIDFHCMSYDVGAEKPDRLIFDAADGLAADIAAASARILGGGGAASLAEVSREWARVHIGDEYAADVRGALEAGWSAVFVDHGGEAARAAHVDEDADKLPIEQLPELHDRLSVAAFLDGEPRAIRVRGIGPLLRWLSGET